MQQLSGFSAMPEMRRPFPRSIARRLPDACTAVQHPGFGVHRQQQTCGWLGYRKSLQYIYIYYITTWMLKISQNKST